MTFSIRSPSFTSNTSIPIQYTGEGEDRSPPLLWEDPPANTKEFALICDDPDAPQDKPWVHWLVYNIPATVTKLQEDVPKAEQTENPKTYQGINSWNQIGYRGPLPPLGHGVHHYNFKLIALDKELDLKPAMTREEFEEQISGHVLGEACTTGLYERLP